MLGSPYYHPEAMSLGSAPDDFVRLVYLAGSHNLRADDFRSAIEDAAKKEVRAASHSLSSAIGYLLERADTSDDVENIIMDLFQK